MQFAMDVNRILITEHVLHLLQYLNVFTMYHMAKENIFLLVYLHTSLGRSAGTNPFCPNIDRSLVKWDIPKTEEHFHSTRALLVLFCKMLIYLLLTIVGIIHPCIMLVIGSNKITPTCLLRICSHIIPKHLLPSGHRQPMYRIVIMNLLPL